MDQYTKMCKAATEIQKAWEPKVGQRFYENETTWYFPDWDKSGAGVEISKDGWDALVGIVTKDGRIVYLPSIEDLIEMSGEEPKGFWYQIVGFMAGDDRDDIKEIILDYIMHILHNKSWNGEEWIEK